MDLQCHKISSSVLGPLLNCRGKESFQLRYKIIFYLFYQAELNCLTDLINMPNWEYALDMAGSEVMTFTNQELVANLTRNLGKIYTESFPMPRHNFKRFQYKHTGHGMKEGITEQILHIIDIQSHLYLSTSILCRPMLVDFSQKHFNIHLRHALHW